MKVHYTTNITPLRFVLSKDSTQSTLPSAKQTHYFDNNRDKSIQAAKWASEARTYSLQSKAGTDMRANQQRYKHNDDKLVRVTPTSTPDDMLCVERPLPSQATEHFANVTADAT